jgi:hypothetical protein
MIYSVEVTVIYVGFSFRYWNRYFTGILEYNYENNQQDALYRLIYYSKSALHVSGDVFAHHQEHFTVLLVFTQDAAGLCLESRHLLIAVRVVLPRSKDSTEMNWLRRLRHLATSFTWPHSTSFRFLVSIEWVVSFLIAVRVVLHRSKDSTEMNWLRRLRHLATSFT